MEEQIPDIQSSKLQLGGGNKKWGGWQNLDELNHFYFTLDNNLPCKDNSQDIVYSSHLLEHLPQYVVEFLLDETLRVLKPYHDFIVKIPDFDKVLANWRAGNKEFFEKYWGLRKVIPTWKSKNVPDTINFRCSMIFCGFWNEEYGSHFKKKISKSPDAYHGPVPMPEEDLVFLLETGDPSFISRTLRELALKQGNITFNHQTAWSKENFVGLLRRKGFFVRTYMNEKDILKEYVSIPDIKELQDISLYVSSYKL